MHVLSLFRRAAMIVLVISALMICFGQELAAADGLRVGVFRTDATPPIGSPVAYVPARSIEDPLSARGIVIVGAGDPIVLCAVDWIGIGNAGHDVWREQLADAAETTIDRVSVHTLHQHDGPRCDFSAEQLLAEHGLGGSRFDDRFARQVLQNTAAAVREAKVNAVVVTHRGIGQAVVEKVASNRRILGDDGKVRLSRMSSCRNAEAIAAPEGTIDPVLTLVSFWNNDQPIACLTYYATHPQSYYGKGDVTSEFVGIARSQREKMLNGLPHIHFNGASGNVAAGKYNDGSPENRPVLAARMADGMKKAWETTVRVPVEASDLEWRVCPVALPAGNHLEKAALQQKLSDSQADARARFSAATGLVFLDRVQSGHRFDLTCLRIGNVYILHMPGELFVEYQLAAQMMRPGDHVCMAAYGDYGTGYIGTEIAYSQGGYETQPSSSLVAPGVEQVLMEGMRTLLK